MQNLKNLVEQDTNKTLLSQYDKTEEIDFLYVKNDVIFVKIYFTEY
jgi:hypothetical protein